MNNFENKHKEISEDADELIELDKLSEEDTVPEELAALDGENTEDTEETDNTEKPVELITVIGVRFKETGKIYYFSPGSNVFAIGEHVIVDTSRGMEYGTVCMANKEIRSSEVVLPIREVIRKATTEDTARRRKNEDLEITAFNTFIERMTAHQLEMKLIDVECAFDNSKLLFYFSAETRIDFRELVRDLATAFHTRIELRQIGIRDEAKMLGGLGICGRPFCCSSFLSDFVQVSIKMAKEQNFSLNSSKVSGACGRLLCCLRYEHETYEEAIKHTPSVGSIVKTSDGEGVVIETKPLASEIKVKFENNDKESVKVFKCRDVKVLKHGHKNVQNDEPLDDDIPTD